MQRKPGRIEQDNVLEKRIVMAKQEKTITTGFGMLVDNDLSSVTAGPKGPVLVQDVHLIEKLAH